MAKSFAIAVAAMGCVAAINAAHAQQATCQQLVNQGACLCAMAIVPGVSPGQLTSAQGNVVVSGPASFSPANGPVGLNVGTSVLLGPDGLATVNFGASCNNSALMAPGNYSVSQVGECACLKSQLRVPGAFIGAGIVTGIVIGGYLAHQQNDQPDAPLSP
jgi:hypothetical protein